MAGVGGSGVLIAIESSPASGTYNTIEAMQADSVRINDSTVDQTSKDSTGLWRQLLDGGEPIRSLSVQGRGILNSTNTRLKEILADKFAAAGTDRIMNFQVTVPNIGTFTGAFATSSIELGGDAGQGATKGIQLESDGAITYAAS